MNIIIHVFCHPVAGDPPLPRNRLGDPVRLLLPGKIHAEYKKLSPKQQFILACTDIQLPYLHLREQDLPDTLLRSRQSDLLFDPAGILSRDRKREQIDLLHLLIDRDITLHIHCGLLILQPLPADLKLHHHPQTQFS